MHIALCGGEPSPSTALELVRKGGFEPPRLSAPPPQDGVSASSTTSALAYLQLQFGVVITPNRSPKNSGRGKSHYSKGLAREPPLPASQCFYTCFLGHCMEIFWAQPQVLQT